MKNTEDIAKKRWENRAVVFGIVSILSNMCALPTSGVPMGIPIGIFSIAFAIISAKGGIRGRMIGIMMGLIVYAMILFVVVQLKDQKILSQFKPEQIKIIQDYIQLYIAH